MRYESESNYCNDHRVRAADHWWKSLDESKMVAQVDLYVENGDECEVVDIPIRFEVCVACGGKGKHVNPSIDCNGLTADDFSDPDFMDDYCDGRYDVQCYGCDGRRVVPAIDTDRIDPATIKRLEDKWQSEAESRAERNAERRMGA
jgi:hypothetical protein